ncbi:unnamed protein product [Penicillium nalgiovense]|uniref:Uncharacterized protein n=1 Tax=Penicillium nalgiovense TaxID=60175 RepID=A0A9W4HPX6_PENNA|nr:unnamed protein product [Penicillium nalgiovense]CAG8033273.1 unnamed protein product [Penicillium nalgiovense]CAG8039000.1 unnamed protein product [Penicillium nalgiovense]CAG8039660.1 unnamed protein product [Penicillium nalgiovense]CAG8057970.1 unnamed protein product [Penicillium nalgiovense]
MQVFGTFLRFFSDRRQFPDPWVLLSLFRVFDIKMANQCSGHVFAIVQATNGNILTWRCSDCNSGPFVAIWRCKICGHCRCNVCHANKG